LDENGCEPGIVTKVIEQIRSSLFRQALFKIQNVEVTHLGKCREPRILKQIVSNPKPFLFARAVDWYSLQDDTKLMSEELWTVDRCGQTADFHVRFYKEGGDGFSVGVLPKKFQDMLRLLWFNLS